MKPLLAAALLLMPWISTTSRAEDPGIDGAQVTIPYLELRALLDAAEKGTKPKPEPKPPVDASLAAARYRLDFSAATPTLTAEFEALTYTEDWHSVALFGGDSRLENSAVTDAAASVIWQDTGYALLAKGVGKFSAKLSLTVPAVGDWEKGEGFVLAPARASVGELRVVGLPADRTLRIDGITPTRGPAGEWVYALPGKDAEWQIVLEDAVMATDVSPIVPSDSNAPFLG